MLLYLEMVLVVFIGSAEKTGVSSAEHTLVVLVDERRD
jgi:hypothetical protein